MKNLKNLSLNNKLYILLIVILLIGIILRWDFIKSEAQKGFGFFRKTERDTINVQDR